MDKINTPLTDADVERFLGNKACILKYSELKNYKTIENLLPAVLDYKIILIEDRYNSGHWVCICRTRTEYYFFNSYGAGPDTDWRFVSRMTRLILGEETNELTRLLRPTKWAYNHVRYQHGSTQTCGRWCVLFISLVCKMMYSMDEVHKFLKNKKLESKLSYDEIVCRLVG